MRSSPAPLRLTLLVLALAGLVLAVPAAEPGKRAFGIEDLYRIAVPAHVDLSPDGTAAVYSLRSFDLPRGKANRDLYRLATAGGDPVRLTWTAEEDEDSPTYSPDGERIAFVALRGAQKHEQIWVMPSAGGEARALTDLPLDASDPLWSPDGRHIAFTAEVYPACGADMACNAERDGQREGDRLEAHVADELLYRHWTSWSDGRVRHVLLLDVDSGALRDMTPGEREAPVFVLDGTRGFDFSPDGKELAFTRNPDSLESLAWSTNSDVWVVPVSPGEGGVTAPARNLTADHPAWDSCPRYSPDGRHLAWLRQARAGYESDQIRLALFERASGATRLVAADFENWIEEPQWLPDSSGLVFRAPSEGRTPLHRVRLRNGAVERVADAAHIDEFALSPDGREAYALRRSVSEPVELWRLDLVRGRPPSRLTGHGQAVADAVDLRPAETMWVEGAAGRRIQVFVVKPHGFDPNRRYPLILNVHGGPQSMWSDAFRGDWQVYPGAGYVVAFANPHGSTGYGQAFTEQISGDWGGRVFEDLMRVTDALERLPYVDRERIGAMGWSYGGYMMNWFQGHTRRFACLASMMGIFDLRAFYYTTEELWFPEWDLGGRPWDSEQYERFNPAASVASFSTPMLIVAGEKDFRVPYAQGLMAFTALRRRGVPARLVVLPEAGHWPAWYEMALYYTAHLDWFARYLGGAAPPWTVESFAGGAVFDPVSGERRGPP